MKRKRLLAAVVLAAGLTPAMAGQVSSDAPDLERYRRIREEGTSRSGVMPYASELMDGIGPRLTGSPGLERAVSWSMDRLAAAGSSNVRDTAVRHGHARSAAAASAGGPVGKAAPASNQVN